MICGWYQGRHSCRRQAVRQLPSGAFTCGRHERKRRNGGHGGVRVRDLVAELLRVGCYQVRQNGSHQTWRTPGGKSFIIVVHGQTSAMVTRNVMAHVRRVLKSENINFKYNPEDRGDCPSCGGPAGVFPGRYCRECWFDIQNRLRLTRMRTETPPTGEDHLKDAVLFRTRRVNPCPFMPTSAPVHYGRNPVVWSSKGVTAAHILVGFNVGGVPMWTLEDVVDAVEYLRLRQGRDPGSSFVAQRGIYRQGPGQTVEEEGVKIDIMNLEDGVTDSQFVKDMTVLGEMLAEHLRQKEVIVEITRRGLTRQVLGVGPRSKIHAAAPVMAVAHNPGLLALVGVGNPRYPIGANSNEFLFFRLDQADSFAWALRSSGYSADVTQQDELFAVTTNAPRATTDPLLRRVSRNPVRENLTAAPSRKKDRHFVGAVTIDSAREYASRNGQVALFEKAWKDYRTFHGCDPTEILLYRIPSRSKTKVIEFGAALGRVPESRYHDVSEPESNKHGTYWIHKHPRGAEPLEVLLARTGLTTKVGGSYRVTKWWYN